LDLKNDDGDDCHEYGDYGDARGEHMNKTKRVAWHKHLKKAKKRREKARVQAGVQTSASQRPAPTRR
jgi:hypothetical protein